MQATATRRFRLGGVEYRPGDSLNLPENQFNDFAMAGLVKRASVKRAKPEAELPVPGNTQHTNIGD